MMDRVLIEKILLDYLLQTLGVPVFLEEPEPDDLPARYIIIEKTGSSVENHIYSATFAIQSYAPTLYHAALLNEAVKDAMQEIIWLDEISRCELNSDYNYTDTATKRYRYQAVFDIVHY